MEKQVVYNRLPSEGLLKLIEEHKQKAKDLGLELSQQYIVGLRNGWNEAMEFGYKHIIEVRGAKEEQ